MSCFLISALVWVHDLAERCEEASPIGVLADIATVPTHDAVNGADDCGRGAEAIEMLNNDSLCGMEQLKPTYRAGTEYSIPKRLGRHVAIDVTRVEVELPIGRLDHRHRGILSSWSGEGSSLGTLGKFSGLGMVHFCLRLPVTAEKLVTNDSRAAREEKIRQIACKLLRQIICKVTVRPHPACPFYVS
jgi:hypothetical protein